MADLDRELRELADHVAWPTGEVAAAVAARLRQGDEAIESRRHRLRLAPLAIAAALAIVVVGVVAQGRDRPATTAHRTKTVTTAPEPEFGAVVSLAAARQAVGINVLVPTLPGLTRPDEVRVAHPPTTGEVALVYRSGSKLPATNGADIGMVVAMFRGRLASGSFAKFLGPGTSIEPTTVQGVPGFWIEGAPHGFAFVDADGSLQTQTFRLAGNVLLWERNGLTLRIESQLPRAQAVRVADSMR